MKSLALMMALALTCAPLPAKPRDWKDAIYLGFTVTNSGAAAMPIGTMSVAVPIGQRIYRFKCENITYFVKTSYTGHWPNLTVNAHTKIALESHNLHVLDEDSKDRKFSIIEKVADTPEPPKP